MRGQLRDMGHIRYQSLGWKIYGTQAKLGYEIQFPEDANKLLDGTLQDDFIHLKYDIRFKISG